MNVNNNKKITVLTTHGRRLSVNINSGTTLLQVLEQACNKYDFNSNEYGLKHHNKEIDLSLMFRYSGLPNNCLLEMFQSDKIRADDDNVVLCIQMEDGTRQQSDFLSSTNFSTILEKLCPEAVTPDKSPVIVYMRKEIYGDALRITTLKSLGIVDGRAMVRLVNKNPDDPKSQANVSTFYKKDNPEDKKPDSSATVKKQVVEVKKLSESLKQLKQEKMDMEEESQKTLQEKVDENKTETIKKTKPDWGASGGGRAMNEKPSTDDKFDDFSGPNETVNEQQDIEELNVFVIGERNAVLFSLELAQKNSNDIPDSFFELTVDDLKLLLRDLRQQQTTEEPLLTEKLRNIEKHQKMMQALKQYQNSVIRIQFPNRLVLQGTFKPTDTIDDVKKFVKKFLKDDNLKFVLFTIPPKNILPLEKTLMEVNCIPTAVLHFGLENNIESIENETFFKDEVLLKLTTPENALLLASKSRSLIPSVEDANSSDSIPGSSTGAIPKKPKSTSFMESSKTTLNSEAPKWFRPQ